MPAEYYTAMLKDQGGKLPKAMPAHALFYFTMLVEKSVMPADNALVVEGSPDPVTNTRNLFKSVAMMYNIKPSSMERYWIEVNLQRKQLGMQRIPEQYQLGNMLVIRRPSIIVTDAPETKH